MPKTIKIPPSSTEQIVTIPDPVVLGNLVNSAPNVWEVVTSFTQGDPTVTGGTPIVIAPPPVVTVPPITGTIKPTATKNTITSFARATGGSILETVYLGEKAIKYTVLKTDAKVADGRRAESVGQGGQTVSEKWIRNRLAIPTDWVDELDVLTVVVFQMHDDNYVNGFQGVEFHSPFDIVVAGKNWLCNVRYGNTSEIGKSFVLAPVVKGKYVEFGVHLKFTKDGSPGIQQIWMDGKLVLDQKLPMGYTHGFQPYYKQGVYAWAMNDDSQAKYLKATGYTSYFAAHEEWDNISVKPF